MDEVKPEQDKILAPAQSDQPVSPTPMPVVTKSHHLSYLLVIGALVLIVIALGAIVLHKSETADSYVSANPTPSPMAEVQQSEIVFIRNKELWSKSEVGSEVQLTQTGSLIYLFKYSPETKTVAYVLGRQVSNPGSNPYLEPVSVFVRDSAAGSQPTMIFELATSSQNNIDYSNQIRDINFSSDGQKLAIATSQSLWIYDIKTASKKQTFDLPPVSLGGGGGGGMIYAYREPIFSPDNSKILLTKGYYEGSGQIIVDVASGSATDLQYSSYVSGTKAFGWKDNHTLLVSEYTDSTSQGSTSKILAVSLPSLQQSLLFDAQGTIYDGLVVDNLLFYKLSRFADPANSQFDSVNVYNLDSQKNSELLSFQTNASGSSKYITSLRSIAGEVYITISDNNALSIKRVYPQGVPLEVSNASLSTY